MRDSNSIHHNNRRQILNMFLAHKNKFRIALDIPQEDLDDIILKCGNTLELGLGDGRMNLVLFFYACEYYYNSESYGLLADDLLSDIYEDVGQYSKLDLSGLYGVGCGIEFLIQFGIVQGDTDVILAELDMKTVEQIPFIIINSDLLFKYEGYILYIMCRLIAPRKENNDFYPFGKCYLEEIKKVIQQINFKDKENIFTLFVKYMDGINIKFNWNEVLLKSF